jgi:hypothetical protein
MHRPKEERYRYPVVHGLTEAGSGLTPFIGKDCFRAPKAAMK